VSAALKQQLRALADARAERDTLVDEIRARNKAFEEANGDLIAAGNGAKMRVEQLESEVRALALHTFDVSQDKKPAPGVEIVLASKLYYDEPAAFAWAQQTGMAVTPACLDKKAFEKIAKATVLPFVEYHQEPAVRIATQLNAAAYADESLAAVLGGEG
jgi:hypothetical protein